ncbi:hypothetical protein [Rhodococcus sp. 14-2470-1a]|uniref:hypothetical protein n=1 Tax=Rhodococcus sp. 14-2470-1a TaxID=2023150 RepID=UPI000B9B07CF|nr:hypothetical protein [Rhodococcus sp. 14-2470-1a]OZF47580.1 hypothetical protein CH292_19355 [Rhodococcus sp. 14-2470-1a]
MNYIDTVVRVLGVITPLAVALLGSQLWKLTAENRKTNSEAKNNDATGAATLSAAALTLVLPYKQQVDEMSIRMGKMEAFIGEQVDWELIVVEKCRQNGGPMLPPPPQRPRF